MTVDKRKLVMPKDAIKTFGAYTVEIKLYQGVSAKFTLNVKSKQ